MPDLRVSFPKPCDERWEVMTPADRARVCARCDKHVHDLSLHTLEEAKALLRGDPEPCVRARIGADGAVAVKPSRRGDTRRMVIAAAATAGLLAASAPAYAKKDRPPGAIAGNIDTFGTRTRIKATSTNGRTFRAKVKRDGSFRIMHLPSGTYSLTFIPDCGDRLTVENVEVGAGETVLPKVESEVGCIIVGMLRVEGAKG